MADRDGLKPASAYPEAIYLQRTHEDGSEMLYPHDATWTETSDCGYDIKYIRADIASPQPAPHAMTEERAAFESSISSNYDLEKQDGRYVFLPTYYRWVGWQARALLAQPAAAPSPGVAEPANPFAGMQQEQAKRDRDYAVTPEYGSWLDSEHAKGNLAHGGNEIWNAAVASVAEPARKAIDAQGAGQCEKCGASTCEIAGIEGVVICDICHTVQEAKALPHPAATLGKADNLHDRALDVFVALQADKSIELTCMDGTPNFVAAIEYALAQQPAASDVRDEIGKLLNVASDLRESRHLSKDGHSLMIGEIYGLQKKLLAQSTPAVHADKAEPIQALIAKHAELLEENEYCYFELAYTRTTEWMAWLCTHPVNTNSDRKVIAKGQGSTPQEACADALAALQSTPAVQADEGESE